MITLNTATLPDKNTASIARGNGLTNNIEWVRGGLGSGFDEQGNPITGGEPVTDFSPKSIGEDNWAYPSFTFSHERFSPQLITPSLVGTPWNRGGSNPNANDYTYWGTGPGTDPSGANYGNWGRTGFATPSERNFKGIPHVFEVGLFCFF